MGNVSTNNADDFDSDARLEYLIGMLNNRDIIEKRVECQVCFQRAKLPIKTCIWVEHVVCAECAGSSENCPTCETPLNDESTQFREEQINCLNVNSCRYYQHGCRKNKYGSEDHEVFCEFRPAVCRVAGCSVQGAMPLKELMKHVATEHKNKVIMREHRFRWKKEPILPVMDFGTLFWLKFPEPNDESKSFRTRLRLTLEAMPIEKPSKEYSIIIKVQKHVDSDYQIYERIKAYTRKFEEEEGIKTGREGIPEWRYENVDYPGQESLDFGVKELDYFTNGLVTLSLQ